MTPTTLQSRPYSSKRLNAQVLLVSVVVVGDLSEIYLEDCQLGNRDRLDRRLTAVIDVENH